MKTTKTIKPQKHYNVWMRWIRLQNYKSMFKL